MILYRLDFMNYFTLVLSVQLSDVNFYCIRNKYSFISNSYKQDKEKWVKDRQHHYQKEKKLRQTTSNEIK